MSRGWSFSAGCKVVGLYYVCEFWEEMVPYKVSMEIAGSVGDSTLTIELKKMLNTKTEFKYNFHSKCISL